MEDTAPVGPTSPGVAASSAADPGSRAVDPAALALVWGPRLYRYFLRLGAASEEAQDLTQETLLRAVRHLRTGPPPGDLAAWLFAVAANLLRDDRRSAYRRRVLVGDPPELSAEAAEPGPALAVEARAANEHRRAALGAALRSLAPDLREIVVLRFWEEQPVRAIAEIIGIPEGTVKSRLYRAYRQLERVLADWRPGGRAGDGEGDGGLA